MKDELFQELLESIREGGAILRGEAPTGPRQKAGPSTSKAPRRPPEVEAAFNPQAQGDFREEEVVERRLASGAGA